MKLKRHIPAEFKLIKGIFAFNVEENFQTLKIYT